MKRVVISGLGIVSCLGNNKNDVLESLLNTKSGITFSQEQQDYHFKSHICGAIKNINAEEHIDKKHRRFMSEGTVYAYIAMQEAITDAGLNNNNISNDMTGIIIGSGGPSIETVINSIDTIRKGSPRKMGPFAVPKAMSSNLSANLAVAFQIKGVNYSISSACSSSGHCIGNAMETIQMGKQNIVFAGGGEELAPALSAMFDAMNALSSKYNDTPETASRAYDKNRDGFVIASGGGILVLEELEHAKARGAKIYAEITGYGATSDGSHMVIPSGEGAVRCMNSALKTTTNKIDYINTHGTSTPVGDITELDAIKNVFGNDIPKISSTKSLTGHPLGAAAVHEAIYCLIMMENNFIAASANISNIDDGAKDFPIVQQIQKNTKLNAVMTNSFGFGGTNATLIFEKY